MRKRVPRVSLHTFNRKGHCLRWVSLYCLLPMIFLLQSCSYQAWFEGFKISARQDCRNHYSDDQVEACLKEVNSMTYESYRREHEKQTPHDHPLQQ